MTKFRYQSIAVFCLIVASGILISCEGAIPATETIPTPTLAPTAIVMTTSFTEVIITHPELEPITQNNLQHIEEIDQWGQGGVHGVALSPDGNLIAVSTSTGIYLYDRKTVKQTGYIDIKIGNENDVETMNCSTSGNLSFSPDGSTLAIANTNITLWDLKAESIQAVIWNKIEDKDSIITEIQFSSDGSRIFGIQKTSSGYPCYSGWGSLVIYTVDNKELIYRHDYGRYEEGPGPAFTEIDETVFISFPDTLRQDIFLQKVNLRTGQLLEENASSKEEHFQAHISNLTALKDIENLDNARVKVIPHSDRVIIRKEQELTVRNLEGSVICSNSIDTEKDNVFLPEYFSSDGSIALSWNHYGYRAGDIHVWYLEQCAISEPILIFPEAARQLSISRDGRSVLTGSRAGYTFHVFDVKTGQLRFSLSGIDAQFSTSGEKVFVVEDDAVNAYDVQTGEYLHLMLEIESNYMTYIIVSPDSQFIAISDQPHKDFQIYRIGNNSSEIKPTFLGNGYFPYFSENKKFMATIKNGTSSQFWFWDLNTGKELPEWNGLLLNESYINPSFNSDFTKVVTSSNIEYRRKVYLWHVPSFSLEKVLLPPYLSGDRHISNLKFISNDNMLFAFGSNPDTFLFWDIQTGDFLHEVPAEIHGTELGNPIVFSPDERLILALDSDGTIHVWGVK